jgi:hypothetical protein
MKLSDETRAVDMIRSGTETVANRNFRLANEEVAMSKAFVKAAFVDLQTTVFMNMDYSPHRIEQFLEQTKRFEDAIRAYQKTENKLLILYANVNAPVGEAAVRPGDLSPQDESTREVIKELHLNRDEAGLSGDDASV